MITALLVLLFGLWIAIIVVLLLLSHAERLRAEMHITALRRLQFVAEPGAQS